MKDHSEKFISEEILRRVNTKIEQELEEYLKEQEVGNEEGNKSTGNKKFYFSVIMVIILYALIKLTPIVFSFLK